MGKTRDSLRAHNRVLVALARSDALARGDLEAAMGQITATAARALDVARVGVWLFTEDRSKIRCVARHPLNGAGTSTSAEFAAADYPAYFRALGAERAIAAHNALFDRRTREFAETYLRPQGITSVLDVPIRRAGQVVGILNHEHVGPRRRWRWSEQRLAASLADFTALAMEAHERRCTEAALRASEERYRDLFENATDLLFTLDRDGNLTAINNAVEAMFGITREEALQRSLAHVLAPEAAPSIRALIRAMASGKHPPVLTGREVAVIAADGRRRTLEVNARLVCAEGKPVVIQGAARDVTERKRLAEEVARSERQFRSLVTAAHDSIVMGDLDGKIVYANESAVRLLGADGLHELIGRDVFEFVHEDERKALRRVLLAAIHAGRFARGEYLVCRRDGSTVPVEATRAVLRDAAGQPIGFMSIGRDLSERKRAERALEERARVAAFMAEVNAALSHHWCIQGMLQGCAEAMVHHLEASLARIWTLNEAEGVLELRASAGLYTHLDGAHSRVPLGQLKIGLIAQERKPLLTNEVVGDPRVNDQEWARREGMVAFAGHPLLDGERVLGVMAMFARQPLGGSTLRALALAAGLIAQGIERLRADEALRRSEERFTLAVEGARDAIWDWDLQTGDVYVSPRFTAMLGYGREDFDGSLFAWAERLHPDDLNGVISEMTIHLQGRTDHFAKEQRIRDKSGTYRWILARGLAVRDATGKPVRMAGSITDITERKEVEAQLRLFETAVANLNDMVIITSECGQVLYVNDAFERHLGFARADVIGRTLGFLQGPKTHPEVFRHFLRNLETQRAGREEILVYRQDGMPRWVEVDVTPLVDRGAEVVRSVAVVRDVTERKTLEEQLREAQKMEAVGRLAGAVAHDFNNQLTVVKSYGQFLLNALPEHDPRRADVEQINATVDRGARLVRHLLAMSRRQPSKENRLRLNNLVSGMVPMLEVFLGGGIRLEVSADSNLWAIKADRVQIERMIMNLVANAKDALAPAARPGGEGTVAILLANVHLTGEQLRVLSRTHAPGAYVMLAVADTGIGMSAETRQHAFEPYFTTKARGKGAGLGLSTVASIVEQCNGFIACESEPGRGATFRIYLPRCARPASRHVARVESHSARRPPLRVVHARISDGATALVVEDEADVRAVVRRALEEAGYTVHVAASAAGTLEVAAALDSSIDLLVADVMMPGGSGVSLAQRLQAMQPKLRVLFISGYFKVEGAAAGVRCASFLYKPFSPAELVQAVRRTQVAQAQARS